ncbi:glycosyl hydrolase [Pontibacter beigongshangensis]|uniref:glycosyl hydrolase n=1 Tax=Pontibacter beigongshangensis TaxID=2574733 RepID=UPI0016501F42|nr:glycosyl hydrolase [Pontibacter beigongshangensis]
MQRYILLSALVALTHFVVAQKPGGENLAVALQGFNNVQDSARTKVWWFHGETETTKEGITADLEAFKRAGVGGVVYYDQSHGKAENALPGFSPEWWKMLRFSAEEAKRLGLSFEIHLSNGYVAGGPWVTDEYGMKRLTATETVISGGKAFAGKLEEPVNAHGFYRDVAVLAFPAKSGAGVSSSTVPFSLHSNVAGMDFAPMFNPQSASLTRISPKEGGVLVDLSFSNPFEARSISYQVQPKGKATTSATNVPGPPSNTFVGTGYRALPDLGQLEASDDGVHYRKVCDLKPIYRAHESWKQKTISFPAIKAKHYRLRLHNWWEQSEKNKDMLLGSVTLNAAAKLDQWEEKAGLFSEYIEADKTPAYAPAESIDARSIINLTGKMDAEGVLRWDVPPGSWVVMRFAYVPTGAKTKHGRTNLIGRECDKLSVRAAELQWENYVEKIADSLAFTQSGSLSGVAMDSHEAGAQNWTDNFIDEFTKRRGYDPTPFLPAMMGYVVNSVKESDGFLFDVRRNIADMIADNYYGTFERLSKSRGLTFTAQAIGNALCFVGDPIQAKSKVSKPQGEFWAIHPEGNYDIKESSSAAHLYGKRIASGEAYTDAKYSASLADLKSLADYAYAFGINEFVICASAYQPWLDKLPGSTGGGRHYAINRNNTWWNYSRPFWDYQARNAAILRTGKSSIDLCVYLGENAPVKILTYRLPDIPGGYDFDAFTTDALLTRMEGKAGKIMLPDGVSYNMMVLPRNGDITLEALRKIASIVEKGGKVYGPRPLTSGSAGDVGKEQEYREIVARLWGKSSSESGARTYGKGMVYWGMPLAEAIEKAGMRPDVALASGDTKANKIYFAHRKLADADIYFLDNHKDAAEENLFTFAAAGKQVQLWNTVTGERLSLPILKRDKKSVSVQLNLAARESCFIVVTAQNDKLLPFSPPKPAGKTEVINGGWNVHFDEKLGGPGERTLERLQDWTASDNPQMKYYSGTAIYKKNIFIDPADDDIYLDLGNPGSVAQVFINGREAGIVWCSPWQLRVTKYLKKGTNEIEIHVANSLMNRMIYDAQVPESDRITYAFPAIASSEDALVPSGLKEVKLHRSVRSK